MTHAHIWMIVFGFFLAGTIVFGKRIRRADELVLLSDDLKEMKP